MFPAIALDDIDPVERVLDMIRGILCGSGSHGCLGLRLMKRGQICGRGGPSHRSVQEGGGEVGGIRIKANLTFHRNGISASRHCPKAVSPPPTTPALRAQLEKSRTAIENATRGAIERGCQMTDLCRTIITRFSSFGECSRSGRLG